MEEPIWSMKSAVSREGEAPCGGLEGEEGLLVAPLLVRLVRCVQWTVEGARTSKMGPG